MSDPVKDEFDQHLNNMFIELDRITKMTFVVSMIRAGCSAFSSKDVAASILTYVDEFKLTDPDNHKAVDLIDYVKQTYNIELKRPENITDEDVEIMRDYFNTLLILARQLITS